MVDSSINSQYSSMNLNFLDNKIKDYVNQQQENFLSIFNSESLNKTQGIESKSFSFPMFTDLGVNNFISFQFPTLKEKFTQFFNTMFVNNNFNQAFQDFNSWNFVHNIMPANPATRISTEIATVKPNKVRSENIGTSNSLNIEGYDARKGKKLATSIKRNSSGFSGFCARSVSNALERTGLSNGKRGHGYQYADILSQNDNFKEIKVDADTLSTLPAGCVLVYGKGVSNYNRKYGHVEVTLGDGRAASDGVTNHIKPGARVFMPV